MALRSLSQCAHASQHLSGSGADGKRAGATDVGGGKETGEEFGLVGRLGCYHSIETGTQDDSMLDISLFLWLCIVGAIWLGWASVRAKRIKIPSDFWLLYAIALMVGAEGPKALALESNLPTQDYYWALYFYSHNLVALPLTLAGLQLLLRPHVVLEGLKESFVSRWPVIKRQHNDVVTARWMGASMALFGLLNIFFTYPTLLAQAWRWGR